MFAKFEWGKKWGVSNWPESQESKASQRAGRQRLQSPNMREREREGYFGERKWASSMRSVARTMTRVNVIRLSS